MSFLFESGKLRVQRLGEEDAACLVKWLSDPQVLQYYEGRDRPHDLAMVLDSFYPVDEETRCIVEYDAQPIGYFQFYELEEEGRAKYGYTHTHGKIFGMDQFIGETRYWDRGIGKQLIRSAVEYLTRTLGARRIAMDPQTWNMRAIQCYERCGFRKIKLLSKNEMHEGELRDCWLMEFTSGEGEKI
jgi:aminoglycoside 6'-N-acetyltransferase